MARNLFRAIILAISSVIILGAFLLISIALNVALILALRERARPHMPLALMGTEPPSFEGFRDLNPFSQLRFALDFEQDHSRPLFAKMLGELLVAQDATLVESPLEAQVVIRGRIVCNGYQDIFFLAEVDGFKEGQLLFTLLHRPTAGDRQINLAQEIVARLKQSLKQQLELSERQRALEELGE